KKLQNYVDKIGTQSGDLKHNKLVMGPIFKALADAQEGVTKYEVALLNKHKSLLDQKTQVDDRCRELKQNTEGALRAAIKGRIDEIETIDETTTTEVLVEKIKMLVALKDDRLLGRSEDGMDAVQHADSIMATLRANVDALGDAQKVSRLNAVLSIVNLDNIMPLDGLRHTHEETEDGDLVIYEAAVSRKSVEALLAVPDGSVNAAMRTRLESEFKASLKAADLSGVDELDMNGYPTGEQWQVSRNFISSVDSKAIALTLEGHAFDTAQEAAVALRSICAENTELCQSLTNLLTSDAAEELINQTRQGFVQHEGSSYAVYRPQSATGELQAVKRYLKIDTSHKPQITFYVADVGSSKTKQSVRVHMEVKWAIEGHASTLEGPLRITTKPCSLTTEVVYHANAQEVGKAETGWLGALFGSITGSQQGIYEQSIEVDYTAGNLVVADQLGVKEQLVA
ncbi:MAG TPA: hypothetical protein PLV25_01720, partial [Opitutales bacterium]|nr:hypothetical protein [Opitutales bacterium]